MEIQNPITEPSEPQAQVQAHSSQAPKMSLEMCCMVVDKPDSVFWVKVPTSARVINLHKQVQSERGFESDILQGVSPYLLELWKIQDTNALAVEPSNTLCERIKLMGSLSDSAEQLCPTTRISEIFSTQPSVDHIQIIVKISGRSLHCIAGGVAKRFHEELDDEPGSVKRLKFETGKASPSVLAFPNEFRKIMGPEHTIRCNRPFETTTIPLVLLHEVFGLFKDRCLQRPSGTAMACLNQFTHAACQWYGSEAERRDAILKVLSEHLKLTFHPEKVSGTEYTTDGNLTVIVMPSAARDCKNEAGHGLNQIILYYCHFLKNALDDPQHFYNFDTRFPCILLVDMGSHFAFYGAVWDGLYVMVEPLIRPLDLAIHWMESKSRAEMASSFDALVLAVNNMQVHYKNIKAEADATPVPKQYNRHLQQSRKFPFLTSYIDGGQETSFTYVARLDEEKLLFSALVNGQDGDCIVKFTQRYSEAAHRCLASHNSAPTLRHCIRICTTWTAVVMDRSMYTTLYGLYLTDDQQEKVRRKVGKTLQVLHDAGFVHGDLRKTNILIDLESLDSNDVRIHFVDFDWAGRIGEAKYPDDINRITVRRPEGTEGGELITVEHDRAMLSYMFRT